VAVAVLISLALVQWSQFWSAGLDVIVQGSALTRSLPLSRRPFAVRLSRLPMISVAVLLPAITLVLGAAGMPWVAALLTSLVLGSALLLYLAAVLAWQDESMSGSFELDALQRPQGDGGFRKPSYGPGQTCDIEVLHVCRRLLKSKEGLAKKGLIGN